MFHTCPETPGWLGVLIQSPTGDLKFTMFQTELIISYLPRSASLFLPWLDEIFSHSVARTPVFGILIASSLLPTLGQPTKTLSCWAYFINIPYTHPLLWILSRCPGLGLHHFFSKCAFASLLNALPRVFKAGEAIGIWGRTAVHLWKVVWALCDFSACDMSVPPCCNNQCLLPHMVLERSLTLPRDPGIAREKVEL